jgi:adenylosuccinate synthase
MRMADLISPNLPDRIREIVDSKRVLLSSIASPEDMAELDAGRITELCQRWAKSLGPMIKDTTYFLHDQLDAGKKLLMEGAQGSLLDIDHGTYPFVTSSNASGVGVCSGSGVPPRWIDRMIGVAKAYSTRVGGGPFPTELLDETGQKIREIGREYGTTTGRPRRCGWFDAVAVRYTARLSGANYLSLMMLDVLSYFDELKVCIAYELDGERTDRLPSQADALRRCKPIYETIPGWSDTTVGVTDYNKLPKAAQHYLNRIAETTGVPIHMVSTSPDRDHTILLTHPYIA